MFPGQPPPPNQTLRLSKKSSLKYSRVNTQANGVPGFRPGAFYNKHALHLILPARICSALQVNTFTECWRSVAAADSAPRSHKSIPFCPRSPIHFSSIYPETGAPCKCTPEMWPEHCAVCFLAATQPRYTCGHASQSPELSTQAVRSSCGETHPAEAGCQRRAGISPHDWTLCFHPRGRGLRALES